MRNCRVILVLVVFFGLAGTAWADVIMLKSGETVTGKFQGATQTTVEFLVSNEVRQYRVADINSITFTPATSASTQSSTQTQAPTYAAGRSTPPASNPATPARSTAPPASMGVTVPAGTILTVRMIDPVDSSTNSIGQTFRASLDEPLVVNAKTVASRGADVTVKLAEVEQAGRLSGRSELTLVLMDITVEGRKYEITTNEVYEAGASRGAQSAKRIGGLAAVGAVIGAIAGGGKGAAQGAAAGAGAGTAIQVLTHGEEVKIPPEARLEFTLQNPFTL